MTGTYSIRMQSLVAIHLSTAEVDRKIRSYFIVLIVS